MIKLIDISHYQGNVNFTKVKNAGYVGVIAKCTEGTSFIDPKYASNRDGARNAGLLFGSYHFFSPSDPINQADFFLKNVGTMQKGEFLVLDFEIQNYDPDTSCLLFLNRCLEKTGIKPLIYMNSSTASGTWTKVLKGDFGLLIAKYGNNDGTIHPNPPIGKWPFFVLHQYTSRGKVDGIVGNVDLNYGNITLDVLKKYGKQGVTCSHKCELHCSTYIP